MILKDKTILVTGGTGSMGKTFVHRALSGVEGLPKKVIVLSRDEAKQHYMRQEYLNKKGSTDEVIFRNFLNVLEFRIGDVRNYEDVCASLKGVDIVINAAALKQVPICEYFPHQAVLTNCQGAQNLTRAINEHKFPVETLVGVSTDKACKPVNVMGMTKALQERIFISANVLTPETRFVCVRYGNVLASRGSVIPLFHQQIQAGGPITITDPKMTRFLLSLDDAVDTVLAAIKAAKAGETYIPIAPSANILHLANALIASAPGGEKKLKTVITGIRPGEKLHEILVSEEEAFRTYRAGNYYAIQPMLPELLDGTKRSRDLISEYSSGDDVLNYEDTLTLLRKNQLLDFFEESPEKKEMIR